MNSIKWLIILAALSLIGFQAKAQVFTKYQSTETSTVSVTGTSTLHNWSEKLKKFDVSFLSNESGTQTIVVKDVQFKAQVGNLESESSLMSDKTFTALKKAKYPLISFVSDQETTMSLSGDKFSGKVSGKLTVAGTTKEVLIPIEGTLENGAIAISCVYPISMSDYGIKPPTALFGSIKSGNDIQVHFNLKFNK
ncbi:MAG: YceI family protein [Bacteroidales bacterium]|nr:YceI family protein [Bacteroidales bacterium]